MRWAPWQCAWQAPPPFRISWPRWRGAGERRTIQPRGSAISPARGAAVLAARVTGGARTTHVRRVTLLLAGETAPRRARVRAAAAAAAANSGRAAPLVLSGYVLTLHVGGRVIPSPAIRRVTACVIAGCVGHASVHCDCGPRAWGPGERARARCVFHRQSFHFDTEDTVSQQQSTPRVVSTSHAACEAPHGPCQG